MSAPPARTEISDTYPLPDNDTARVGFGRLWDYVTGLLGATDDAPEARTALGAASASRVKGLIGAPTAATPLTKYDLSADEVVLRNSSGGMVTRYLTGAITNNLGLAGSAANGRDQAAAFTASSWIYLYFIWNGTTLATISSTAVPTTGPTLPTGYTHWAFATALRWNASSNIIPVLTHGSSLTYDIGASVGAANRALSAGTATTFTAVSLAGIVPPNTLMVGLNANLVLTHNTAGVTFKVLLRVTGSADPNGIPAVQFSTQVSSVACDSVNAIDMAIGTSQQIDYKVSAAPSAGYVVNIDVLGFKIPNGDS